MLTQGRAQVAIGIGTHCKTQSTAVGTELGYNLRLSKQLLQPMQDPAPFPTTTNSYLCFLVTEMVASKKRSDWVTALIQSSPWATGLGVGVGASHHEDSNGST